jgi:hypothetical protein
MGRIIAGLVCPKCTTPVSNKPHMTCDECGNDFPLGFAERKTADRTAEAAAEAAIDSKGTASSKYNPRAGWGS